MRSVESVKASPGRCSGWVIAYAATEVSSFEINVSKVCRILEAFNLNTPAPSADVRLPHVGLELLGDPKHGT